MALAQIVEATRQAVDRRPEAARVTFTVGGGNGAHRTEVELNSGSGHRVVVDEPAPLGGNNTGANPVEHALVALASCQVISWQFWAGILGIELDRVQVEAEGDLDVNGFFGFDADVRPGFTAVRVSVTPIGPESAERYRQLHEAVESHCPVLDLFANPTPVTTNLALPVGA